MGSYEQEMPPGLMEALSGGGAAPAEEPEKDSDSLVSEAIKLLEQAIPLESDSADSKALSKALADLYAVVSSREDASMTAMGGNPKQLRSMARASGGAQ